MTLKLIVLEVCERVSAIPDLATHSNINEGLLVLLLLVVAVVAVIVVPAVAHVVKVVAHCKKVLFYTNTKRTRKESISTASCLKK
jgi:hypothetical protein